MRLCDLLTVTRLEICGSYVIVAPSVLVSLRLRQVKVDFSKCFPFSNKIHHFVAKFLIFFYSQAASLGESPISIRH